jgi:salicylate hydroxylase
MGSVTSSANREWKQLDIAVVGGGIGGLCASISLRRAGHKVTIYERAHFAGEVGASISCAVNGGRWLHEWGVNIDAGRPVELKKLIAHDWKTGAVKSCYDLKDYKKTWGRVRLPFLAIGSLLTEVVGILYVPSC